MMRLRNEKWKSPDNWERGARCTPQRRRDFSHKFDLFVVAAWNGKALPEVKRNWDFAGAAGKQLSHKRVNTRTYCTRQCSKSTFYRTRVPREKLSMLTLCGLTRRYLVRSFSEITNFSDVYWISLRIVRVVSISRDIDDEKRRIERIVRL